MTKNEQVTRAGNIVLDYDQTLTKKEIDNLMSELFGPVLTKEDRQYVLYSKIGILACNVTYLNNPHPLYKKRIQLKSYYLDYLAKNSARNMTTLYVGIYTYKRTRLFVVFETDTFACKKSHNSSAHVYSINLQYAQRAGKFDKVDAFGNVVRVFNTYEFVRYIKTLGGELLGGMTGDDILELINNRLSSFKESMPKTWNGIDCYRELIAVQDNNARQGHWEGWYFEHLFRKYLADNHVTDISWHADKTEGGIDLDIKFENKEWTYGDLKADQLGHDIQGNAFEPLDLVIKDHGGVVYYVCCLFKSEKDSQHGYQVTRYWNTLRDEPYTTEEDIRNRYGKQMKFSVTPKRLVVLKIDGIIYDILKQNPFHQGLNSDGNERKPKLKVDKDMIEALSVFSTNFD